MNDRIPSSLASTVLAFILFAFALVFTGSAKAEGPLLVSGVTPSGMDAIQFDGVANHLDISGNPEDFDGQAMTQFVVFRTNNFSEERFLLSSGYSTLNPGDPEALPMARGHQMLTLPNNRMSARHRNLTEGVVEALTPAESADSGAFNLGVYLLPGTGEVFAVLRDAANQRLVGDASGINSDPQGHLFTRIGAQSALRSALPPEGFFDGEIAAVLIYNRGLDFTELFQMEEYLYEAYLGEGPGEGGPPVTFGLVAHLTAANVETTDGRVDRWIDISGQGNDAVKLPAGFLTVDIEPSAAGAEGGQWSVDGGATWHDGGQTVELAEGDYTVTFSPVSLWESPDAQAVSIEDGIITSLTGTYIALPTGHLTVNIEPAGAVAEGARWSVDGGATWYDSGQTVEVAEDDYAVTFRFIQGWRRPSRLMASVLEDQTVTVSGADGANYEVPEDLIISDSFAAYTDTNDMHTAGWFNSIRTAASLGTDPNDETNNVLMLPSGSGQRLSQAFESLVPTDANPIYFEFDFYDFNDGVGRQFGVISNADNGGTGIARGMIAIGLYDFVNTGEHAPDQYQFKVRPSATLAEGNASAGTWANLAAKRVTEDWVTFGLEIKATTLTIFVNGVADPNAIDVPHSLGPFNAVGFGQHLNALGLEGHYDNVHLEVVIPPTGFLTVDIEPSDAVSAGAQWSVDHGATWNDSGETIEVSEGNYTLAFNEVPGWRSPKPMAVSVSGSETTTVTGADGAMYHDAPELLHVSASTGDDGNDGSSWGQAFATLQAAVDAAGSGTDVWVSAGTYTLDDPEDDGPVVVLAAGVSLYGGFAGNETARGERDWEANESTIDGQEQKAESEEEVDENRRSVMGANNTILDGFTMTRGGITNQSVGSVTVRNSTFVDNVGSGIVFLDTTEALVENCSFIDNPGNAIAADDTPGIVIRDSAFMGNRGFNGGAVNLDRTENALFEGCLFVDNGLPNSAGAAILVFAGSNMTVRNSEFLQHFGGQVDIRRGVIHFSAAGGSKSFIENCVFAGNETGLDLFSAPGGVRVVNTVFTGNVPALTGPISGAGSAAVNRSNDPLLLELINCTFTENQGTSVLSTSGSGTMTGVNSIIRGAAGISGNVTLTHSNVEGGYAGDGNIDADPLFVEAPDSGSDATWGTTDDNYGNVRLQSGSPSIDLGDNTPFEAGGAAEDIAIDGAGNLRIVNSIVDMGAFEFAPGTTYVAWAAGFDFPVGLGGPEADASGDGIVNLQKYAFGLDPLEASRQGLPVIGTETVSGEEYLTLTATRDPQTTGIEVIVEASEDLVIWDTADVVVLENSPETLRARSAHPLSERQRQFLRVVISLNE